jgi:hypothetical protein
VEASKYVAIHLYSARATITGGVVIDITDPDLSDAETWCDYHGVVVAEGRALVYKAVDDELASGRGFTYPLGESVACDDWRNDDQCGRGLHFSPTPNLARSYFTAATRFLACWVALADLAPIDGTKCKARAATVDHEVDAFARPLAVAA